MNFLLTHQLSARSADHGLVGYRCDSLGLELGGVCVRETNRADRSEWIDLSTSEIKPELNISFKPSSKYMH